MLAVALATLGRNTAFALATVFAWMAVIEGLIRGLRPGWAQYLWGENLATTLTWAQMENVDFTRGHCWPGHIGSTPGDRRGHDHFQRRDIAGSS